MTNPLATRALLYGVLSLFFGLLTLLSVVGFAGAVTGTFALFYGVLACQQANRSPQHPGLLRGVLAICLGSLTWGLLLLLLLLRFTAWER